MRGLDTLTHRTTTVILAAHARRGFNSFFFFYLTLNKTKQNKNKNKEKCQVRPSREGGRVGSRCSHIVAFPRQRATARLLKRCLVELGEPVLCSIARPRDLMVLMVSPERPPRVSVTRGMNSIPTERQADRWEASLRRVPTSRACPGVEAACPRVCR